MFPRKAATLVAYAVGGAASLAVLASAWALPADPDLDNWKDGKNNCYNYATNRHDDDFKQPGGVRQKKGVGANQTGPEWCDKITARAEADGLKKLPGGEGDPIPTPGPDSNLVCLVAWPGTKGTRGDGDYHWYRKNGDGSWSHKPGGTPAQKTYHKDSDNTDPDMDDPRVEDQRDGYTAFCGWFAVPKSQANPPMQTIDPPHNGCLIISLAKSGPEDHGCPVTGVGLDPLRERIPTLSPSNQVPDPLWKMPDAGEYRGMGLEAGPFAGGFPPYLRVYNGVVAVYSDIMGTTITYYNDDGGLEPYLQTFETSVPGVGPWGSVALTALLAAAGLAAILWRRRPVAGII